MEIQENQWSTGIIGKKRIPEKTVAHIIEELSLLPPDGIVRIQPETDDFYPCLEVASNAPNGGITYNWVHIKESGDVLDLDTNMHLNIKPIKGYDNA